MVLASALQGGPAISRHPHKLALACVEYCLAVPADRFGSAVYPPARLKTMYKVTSLIVFAALGGVS